jgi:hypothetical protein
MQLVAMYQNNTCTVDSIHNTSPTTFTPIPSGARQRVVTRQAINVLTIQEKVSTNRAFTPTTLMEFAVTHGPTKF